MLLEHLLYMLKVYFSEVLKSILLRSMKEVLKTYTFLVLLASENLSPNVLKVYFFHASSVLHFTRNFKNFQLFKFVKSARSMLKVYFYSIIIFFIKVQKYVKCAFYMLLVICILRKNLEIFNQWNSSYFLRNIFLLCLFWWNLYWVCARSEYIFLL